MGNMLPTYQRVLIAIDFSAACKQVLQRGIDIARYSKADAQLVHVVEYLPPLDFGYEPIIVPDWHSNEEAILQQAEKSLSEIAGEHGLSADKRNILTGTAKTEIIRYADEHEVDLIVIGSHGRHGLQRLLGSTATPVLNNANCDVLAVRITE